MSLKNTRTFRLFISPTFNDLRAERDILQERVFPKLREYCESKGFNFLPIDLRWGVSQEAGYDQKTMKIYIDEVKRAKESLSPHFVVLLGDRYGWIPLPYEIEADEFEKIREVFYKKYDKDSKEIKYLNKWYKKDENSIPPKYILQPRVKKEHQKWEYWGDVEKTLREAFMDVVEDELKDDLSEEAKIKYLKSATEQEIIEGIFKNNEKDKIFFFHREFSNLEDLSEEEIAKLEEKDKEYKKIDPTYQITIKSFSDFIDFTSNKIDKRIRKRHLDLVKRIKKTLPPENIKDYSLKLDPNLKRTQESVTQEYLEEFAKDFEERIKKAIDKEIEKVSKIVKDPQKSELIHQQNFLEEKIKLFIGRDEYLEHINNYIESDKQTPLLITANSGSGKSSLMAAAIKNTKYKTFFRFIGISELSTTPFKVYKSLLKEMKELEEINGLIEKYKEKLDDNKKELIFEDLKELQKLLRFIFENYKGKKIVLFLDALDQFVTKDPLLFLPRELSENIKIILSTLPKEAYSDIDYDERILDKYKEIDHIHLMPFSKNETKDYIDKFLLSHNRKITQKQKEKILSTFNTLENEEKTPLYLKILLEEALNWHSYDDVSNIEFPKKVDDLIKRLFEELHTIHHHSKPLIDYAFSVIACSRDGMPEAEIFDILSLEEKVMKDVSNDFYPKPLRLPTAVWARLYTEIKDYITIKEIDGMEQISFFHRKFNEGAYKLLGKEKTHEYLSKYYERVYKHHKEKEDEEFIQKGIKTTLESALVELPYQLIMSNQKEKTLKLLTDFDFLMEKFKLNKVDEVLEDYELAKERFEDILKDETFFIYDRFINSNKHLLRRGNDEWDASKIFFQLSIEHADNSPLTIAAERYESEGKVDWDYFRNVYRPNKMEPLKMIIIQPKIRGVLQLENEDILTYGESIRIWDKYFNLKDEIFIKDKYEVTYVEIKKVFKVNNYILVLTDDNQIKEINLKDQKTFNYNIDFNLIKSSLNSELLIKFSIKNRRKRLLAVIDKNLKKVFILPRLNRLLLEEGIEIKEGDNIDIVVFRNENFVILKNKDLTLYKHILREVDEFDIECLEIAGFDEMLEYIDKVPDLEKQVIKDVNKIIHLQNDTLLIQQENKVILLDSEFNRKHIEFDNLKEILVADNYILIQTGKEATLYDSGLNKITSYIVDGTIYKIDKNSNTLFLITYKRYKGMDYKFIIYKIDNEIEKILEFIGKQNFKFLVLNNYLILKPSRDSHWFVFNFEGEEIGTFNINDYKLMNLSGNLADYDIDNLKIYDFKQLINYKEEDIKQIKDLEEKIAYLFNKGLCLIDKEMLKKEPYNYNLDIVALLEVNNKIYVSMCEKYNSRSSYYIGKLQTDFTNLIIENINKTNKLVYPRKRTYTQNYIKVFDKKLILSFSDEILVLDDKLNIIFQAKNNFNEYFEEAFLLKKDKLLVFKFTSNYRRDYEVLIYDIHKKEQIFSFKLKELFDIYEFNLTDKYLYFVVRTKNDRKSIVLNLEAFNFESETNYFREQALNEIRNKNTQKEKLENSVIINENEIIIKNDKIIKYIDTNSIDNCNLIDKKRNIFKLDNKFIKLIKAKNKLLESSGKYSK